ncbi:MAG TPA: RNA polymerase sigma factor [Chloroflexota bacterium]
MVAIQRDAMATDERLAALAASGSAAAFQALAERYSQPAFAYAYHFLGGYDDAHDAVQEALIQVYRALPKARSDLPFRPWFYSILRHKCLDALRKRRPLLRLVWQDEDGAVEAGIERFPDPAPLPEELYERQDLQRVLHEVISELPPTYRDAVLLRYATDLTFEEMAEVLHVPVNTVKTHFQRAKHLLRPLLLARQIGQESRGGTRR